ncbi:MAG: PDZ domain-containing protein [Clostridia bacterium]|nr:PDZ domain-containing protein [Clostridia bacterium]
MKKILIILTLLILLAYASNITQIPQSIILFQGENLKISTLAGITLSQKENYNSMQTSSILGEGTNETTKNAGKTELSLKLFDSIPIKDVTVDVIPKTKVVPVGATIGLKLYTKGVLVVGVSEVETNNNLKQEPYANSGIKEGDTILTVNEQEVSSTEELVKKVNESKGKDVKITFDSNGEVKTANIKPSMEKGGTYKLGLWVRDAAAGVGTVSYYEEATKTFSALGHGIQDIDTGKLITISNGEVVTATITDIIKGEEGRPRRNIRKYFIRKINRQNFKKYSIWNIWKA